MSTATLPATASASAKPLSRWEWWGRAMLLPYVVVFGVFVLFPVGYGLWLARDPQNYVKLEGRPAQQMIKLMEALEEHEDTKKVWSNADIKE